MLKSTVLMTARLALVLGLTVTFPLAARADVTFNFEELAQGGYASIVSTQGGITATLYKIDSSSISVSGPQGPASWLNNSLLAFQSGSPLVIDFSQPVSNVSIQFGDFDSDNDTAAITAYAGLDGLGAVLGTNSVFYPLSQDISTGDADVGTLPVTGSGIQSVVITSPSDATNNPFPFSIYFDNLVVGGSTQGTVPEPTSIVMLGSVLLGLMTTIQRKFRS